MWKDLYMKNRFNKKDTYSTYGNTKSRKSNKETTTI